MFYQINDDALPAGFSKHSAHQIAAKLTEQRAPDLSEESAREAFDGCASVAVCLRTLDTLKRHDAIQRKENLKA